MSETSSKKKPKVHIQVREKHAAWKVLGIIAVLALVLGVLAFRNIKRSIITIDKTQKEMVAAGKKLNLEGCVQRVLKWKRMCGAIHVICRSSIPRMTAACLEAKQRKNACRSMKLGQYKTSAHFRHSMCKARGLHRRRHWKRECGAVFGTVWKYCKYWGRKEKKVASTGKPTPSSVKSRVAVRPQSRQ